MQPMTRDELVEIEAAARPHLDALKKLMEAHDLSSMRLTRAPGLGVWASVNTFRVGDDSFTRFGHGGRVWGRCEVDGLDAIASHRDDAPAEVVP